MAARRSKWVWGKALRAEEKAEVAAKCQLFIDDILKPRFLPEVRPDEFNYPVDILGKWRGSRYSFIKRYRSGFPENRGLTFDVAFTRLDYLPELSLSQAHFDVMWHRHTGRWWRLYTGMTLEEALHHVETDSMLQPLPA